ncbi:uncharacterized protein [Oryza sativa Japonica Group]|uniref:uncharacterized protein n=1 Tax=Oryza sativa subsp. japonica TaxID=39947 RepID=UPI000E1C344B|nr:disease resistance protein RGA5-like [Oryza sativa Japonica Group]
MASERRKRYNFDETLSSSIGVVPIDPRLPALYAEKENLVGIDTPRVELIRFLTEGEDKLLQKLQVVSIVGLGGLGKTTLARQVYEKIGGQFDCQAFVSVSQKPDIRKIFKNILINITELDYGAIDAWDEERLINKLREFLNDKRGCADMEGSIDKKMDSRRVHHYTRDIRRLFQLKYLRLSEVSISELPEQIGELQELQTLELQRTSIKELPKSIVRLKNLVFLVADGITLPEGIGNMKALQKLVGVKVDISTPVDCLRELGGLNDLRRLYIIWCVSDAYPDKKTYTDSFISCIDELCTFKLRYLQVGCDVTNDSSLDFMLDSWYHPPYPLYNFQMTTYYCFPIIPEWMATLFNVAFLDINVTSVGKDVLRILGDLPSLLSLSITTKTIVSERLVFGSNGFQSQTAGSLNSNFYVGLHNMVCLKNLVIEVDCREARAEQVEATEAAAKNAIANNPLPDHLNVQIRRNWVHRIIKDTVMGNSVVEQQEETTVKIHYN